MAQGLVSASHLLGEDVLYGVFDFLTGLFDVAFGLVTFGPQPSKTGSSMTRPAASFTLPLIT